MKLSALSFPELYRFVGCINSILNISINNASVVVQSGFEYSLDYPVMRTNYESLSGVPQRSNYDFYVASLGKKSLKSFLITLKKYENFNPKARYILIGEKPDNSSISTLMSEFVLNFIFVVLETQEIFTIFPYQTGKLNDLSTDLQKIGSCEDGKLSTNQPSFLFPNKIPPVWKRSNLTLIYSYEAPYSMVTTGQKKGIEIDLLQLIIERIGMDADYINNNDPVPYTMFLLAKHGKYDIRFGNIALSLPPTLDSTLPYSCDSAFWYVPRTKHMPKWKMALTIFSLEVGVTWFLCTFFICLLWDVVDVLMENKRLGKSFLVKMWRIIMILLEQGVKFKTEYATICILIFLILQSFLVLSSLYKAKYTFYLSGTNLEKAVASLDEVMERGLKMGSTSFMIGVYNTTPKIKEYLRENFVQCDTGPDCLNRSALQRDLAVLKPYRKVAYIRDMFRDHYGHNHHHRLPSPVFTLCNTFTFPKGHPMYPLFDQYVHLMAEHGFVQKIIANYDQKGKKAHNIRTSKLKLKAVEGPIFLIVIGSLSGIVVFIVEKSIYKRRF